jgi:LacI family transcriptional regulator
MRELGATAARWLDERIHAITREARRSVLPTRLVVRTSRGVHESGGTT